MNTDKIKDMYRDTEDARKGTYGLILAIWGRDKAGKTHFALTAPPPIFYHDMNFGIHRVLKGKDRHGKKKFGKKELYVKRYKPISLEVDASTADYYLMDFFQAMGSVVEDTSIKRGTVVLDTGNELWTWIQKSKLDEVRARRTKDGKSIYPFDYGEPNLYFTQIINMIKSSGLNLIIVNSAKQLYDGSGNALNQWDMQTNPKVPGAVDGVLFIEHDANRPEDRQITIELNGIKSENEGKTIRNPTFDMVKQYF